MKRIILPAIITMFVCSDAHAQVNSGSNGSDGALNPAPDGTFIINMADHPNGVYHYTSVTISGGVTVTFIPNTNNTPIVWLVQSNVAIYGTVDVSGLDGNGATGGTGGLGGYRGGNGGPTGGAGQGPGGGPANGNFGYGGSYAMGAYQYGNGFLIPLLGGSGGGGSTNYLFGGGGGGGAILIAASGQIHLNGTIKARGGKDGSSFGTIAGGGSGGAVRLVSANFVGTGNVNVSGGSGSSVGGFGRVRLDVLDNNFSGTIDGSFINGVFTQGSQFVIIPSAGQLPQLTVTSVGGVPVSASPTGTLSTPDAVLSAQQNNPIPIVVHCSNIPLNTQITVSVKPANGATVSATGLNNTGTLSSSTATVSIVMPRGGGLIYATAATGN